MRLLAIAALAAQDALPSTTDPVSQGLVAVILIAVFALLTREAAHRVVIVIGAVSVIWLITYLTPYHLLSFERTVEALDLNVLVLLAGMMALVGVLKSTGVFGWGVAKILQRAKGNAFVVIGIVAWLTASTSAFLDNVTTVIVTTPLVIGVARQLPVRPEALLLPMVMASNIGGTATLIGDPPNIMIGSGAHLSFLDFLETLTVPCLIMMVWLEFWTRRVFATDLRASSTAAPLQERIVAPPLENPELAKWMGVIGAAVLLGFLTHHITGMAAAVPATVGAAAALIVQDRLYLRRNRPTPSERIHGVLAVTERDIEWPTLAFFGFLFIIVGAAVQTGLIATMARGLHWAVTSGSEGLGLTPNGTLLFAALLICWVSGLLSALIDNIPFVAVSIPIVAQLTAALPGETSVLWWALSLGACLGGNGTPIGASANVTTIGLAERDGIRITFPAFVRYGAVVAAGTLVLSSLFLAAYVYLGKARAAAVGLVIFAVLILLRSILRRLRSEARTRA